MTIKVEKFYDHKEAQEALRTFHADISIDLMRVGGLFSHFNAKLVRAETQYERILNAFDLSEARRDRELREEATRAGEKVTETKLKSMLAADGKLWTVRQAVLEAREEVGYLKGTLEALKQRKDGLMQLAMNARQELQGSPTVMGSTNRENRNERLKVLAKDDQFIEIKT